MKRLRSSRSEGESERRKADGKARLNVAGCRKTAKYGKASLNAAGCKLPEADDGNVTENAEPAAGGSGLTAEIGSCQAAIRVTAQLRKPTEN